MRLDLRTAMRQLRRAPGTALAAIVTLAVGIGATTAVLSFVSAVMSAASPAPDMHRLVAVWTYNRAEAETKNLVSPGEFFEWSQRARSFATIAASRRAAVNVSGLATPVRVTAQLVTPGYFDVFGWVVAQGRGFTAADAQPGAPRAIVLSHAYWQNRLGGQRDVIGQTLKIDGEPATVVGVLPSLPGETGLYLPLSLDQQRDDRGTRSLFVFARLAPSASLDTARREMESIAAALEREYPATNRGWTVNTRPLQEEFIGPQARLIFALLAGIVTAVLVIGAVNIANLLLARGVARRGEMAVRLALGAGGWRIARQLLIECAVLAALGALASLAVTRWTLRILVSLGAVDSPWLAGDGLNVRVLALTAAVAGVATLIAGVAPALHAWRVDFSESLRGSARWNVGSGQRMMRVLVASQVALAVALLVVAGLASRTLMALERLDPGFDIDNVLTAAVTFPDAVSPDAAARWADAVLAESRRLPGVMSAGATSRLPFAGSRWNPNRGIEIDGQPIAGDENRWAVDYSITPGLLESLRLPLLAGRTFTAADGAGAPLVAIVSETMARRFWPDRAAIGARLRQGDEPAGQWRTVVGIVGDVRNDDADQPPLPYLYMPFAQQPQRTMTLALRTVADPLALAEPLRRAVSAVDADQALYDVRTMRTVWDEDLEQTRLLIQVIGALALVALGLAGLGVWGVAAQAVGQRTREIGVRVALGASAAQVGALVARQGLAPIAIGLMIGLAGGLALARGMRSILFQVSPTDPVTVTVTLSLLLAVGILATLGPALRAARLDPLVALRQD